jgi:hypothetical protein
MQPKRAVQFLLVLGMCGGYSILAQARQPLFNDSTRTTPAAHLEIYSGYQYSDSGSVITRQVPVTNLFYGFTDALELSWTIPYIYQKGLYNAGGFDSSLKYRFNEEAGWVPAFAASVDAHFPSTSNLAGVDQETFQYNWRLRVQKTFGPWSGYVNGGYTLIDDTKNLFPNSENVNSFFGGFAQEWRLTASTLFLSEIFFSTSHTLVGQNRALADVGLKERLTQNISFNGAIGKSIRESEGGGPHLFMYGGLRAEFSFRKDSPPHWPD